MHTVVLGRLKLETQKDGFSHQPGQHSNTDKRAEGRTSRGPQSWKRRKKQLKSTLQTSGCKRNRDPEVGVVRTA